MCTVVSSFKGILLCSGVLLPSVVLLCRSNLGLGGVIHVTVCFLAGG